ncbi:ArnT family glycosyltransferase [Ilumatobacter nonamiensis]|uniref:ArnT family glycosyltransferase n=1 Tax=Ilumatobacter nonamiensis TaxID=467093 RepID=UPI00034CE336|nr:hypothetical protein [Ilumatobacter nonamiensis]
MRRLRGLSDRTLIIVATLTVALPLLVAVVALAQRRWYPVLDLAMTEFRVQDVGTRQTPLIGLPGRIGELPDQGSHPGPLSFWLLAPGYRIFGSSAWAMEAATVSIALGWIACALWIGHRRLGRPGIALVALIIAISIRGFGLSVLTQPWNPYMPLLAWLVILLAVWSVFSGDDLMLLPLVVAASFAAQTHIPYLLMAGGLGLISAGVVLLRWWRARSGDEAGPPRIVLWTVVAFALLWLGPLADQIRRDPGNITQLLDHFGAPDEQPIGFAAGIRLMLRHLDFVGAHLDLVTGSERFVRSGFAADGPIWPGVLLLSVWVVAAVVAVSLRHRSLVALHAVIGVTLALTTVSMARIFGQRWFYLTLWAWITSTLVIVAVLWTAVVWIRSRLPGSLVAERLSRQNLTIAATVAAGISTIGSVVLATDVDHPEEYLGETLAELVEPTAAALDPAQTYVVEWDDAYFFGSQAFGLVSELRRAGFDVGGTEFWRVPMTSSRTVADGTADQMILFATGGFVPEWRSDDRYREIATVDPRDAEERAQFDSLRLELIAELEASGLDDLVPEVDDNLFGLNVDLRISPDAREMSALMIRLGQETSVFLGPPRT